MSTGASQWQANGVGGLYGTSATSGGGGGGITIGRNSLDAARMPGLASKMPDAEYPDGYLGSPNGRRADKLEQARYGELNRRSYTRGVHRGERIDPGDYTWTAEMNMERGIQSQMRGKRQTVVADGPPPTLPNNTTNMPLPTANPSLAALLPAWN